MSSCRTCRCFTPSAGGSSWSGRCYWGATYTFARDPSIGTLLADLAAVRPTVFLSVPKKWEELHEHAQREAGGDDPDAIAGALRKLTGSNLKTGISAAGFLDPLVFKSVQRAGIDLCSGYGTTEGTGGITMTPPARYREGSIGVPLPGIETRIESDGELLVRGPYVMEGYFRPEEGGSGIDDQGWFSTGDIVRADEDGYLWIIDRKKEIYKNRKGQGRSLRSGWRNLFRDFDVVAQVVRGRRPKGTSTRCSCGRTTRPAPTSNASTPWTCGPCSLRSWCQPTAFLLPSNVSSRSRSCLARCPKSMGSSRPRAPSSARSWEQHWSDLIEPMYRQVHLDLSVNDTLVRIPNWLLRELGAPRSEVECNDGMLRVRGRALALQALGSGRVKVGGPRLWCRGEAHSTWGRCSPRPRPGSEMTRSASSWGDQAFLSLTSRRKERAVGIEVLEASAPSRVPSSYAALVGSPSHSLSTLHAAAVLLQAGGDGAMDAIAHLQSGLMAPAEDTASLCPHDPDARC